MNKHIKQLIKLVLDNPEAEVITATDSDIIGDGDDCTSYYGTIRSVELEHDIWLDGDCVGEDEIIEKLTDNQYPTDLSDEEVNKKVLQMFKEMKKDGEIKDYIVIKIGA
jgi:hypothetical protein